MYEFYLNMKDLVTVSPSWRQCILVIKARPQEPSLLGGCPSYKVGIIIVPPLQSCCKLTSVHIWSLEQFLTHSRHSVNITYYCYIPK